MSVITELYLNGKNGTEGFKSIPFATNIPISLNFALADVRNPDQRKASFSKTINLNGTNEINKLFENIFSVNVQTLNFNKNLKTPVKYLVNGIENFKGDLQLLKVNINPDKSIVYECSILGEGGSLFLDIGDKLITGNTDSAEDLDFSAYNHDYTRANQISTRSNLGTGTGVLYPFIDNGTNGGSDTVWNVSNFIPCFSMFEYIKKIIEKTGRTYTSSILTATEFKNQILYPNLNIIALTSAQLANRQFYVGLNANINVPTNTIIIKHDKEAGIFFDAGNQNNIATGYATINDNGLYNIVSKNVYRYKFTYSGGTGIVSEARFGLGNKHVNAIVKVAFGTTPLITLQQQDIDFYASVGGGGLGYIVPVNTFRTVTNSVATGEIQLNSGDTVSSWGGLYIDDYTTYFDSAGTQVTGGTATWTKEYVSGDLGTSFYMLATKKILLEGNPMLVNNALPKKIKQKDVFKSIIQGLNLFVDVDPLDKNNVIIESFDEFYNTSDPVDYENKTDLSKEQSINPNLLEGKKYTFTYKEDKDKWNTKYKEDYGEVFGTEIIDVENDFIKAEKKTELIFSATPNAANYGLGIVHPRIYLEENLIKKAVVPNIRWLYVGGIMQTETPYTYKELGEADLVTQDYLYAGHTDNPMLPTIDLNFGLPKEVYYNFIGAYFTNNNLYNRYHKQYIVNLIDRDGKFVTKYLWLNEKDIYKFNFRNRLFIDGAYYIVNKIENYNPLEMTSTKCELIKLLESPVFVPAQFLISDNPNINSGSGVQTAKMNSALNVGSGIQNKGTNSVAIGDNIIIPESCRNVTVIGDNISIPEGTTDFNYINGQVISSVLNDKGVSKSVSADYNTKAYDDTILVTTGATNKTITLQYGSITSLEDDISYSANGVDISYTVTKKVTIKKVDSGVGNVVINGNGALIEGSATISLITQYESVTLQWDGANWNII